jgi:DNA polymerase-3 subunit alpha
MSPSDLAQGVSDLGMPAVALTDTANMFGAVAFYKACKSVGVKPILGAELTVQHEGVAHADPLEIDGGYQLIALVENKAGYQSLCQLVTKGIFEGTSFKPRVDLSMLRQYSEGLIFITGGLKGLFSPAAEPDGQTVIKERVSALSDFLSSSQLYFEINDLGLPDQDQINNAIRECAKETGYSYILSNAVHYKVPSDASVHETLNAIGEGVTLSDISRRVYAPTDQAWLKSEEAMRAIFPDEDDALNRTGEIAERCNFDFVFDDYHFPSTTPPDINEKGESPPNSPENWQFFLSLFPPPSDYRNASDPQPEGSGTLDGYFRWYAHRGLTLRLAVLQPDDPSEYEARLAVELDIIISMGFPAYLLMVAEFINWSKSQGIPVGPGRGSAAGSLVAYAMRITDIDPIRFSLLFERFLNPARVSMPDIDIDFCQDRREEVIEYVRDKYGAQYVSQIITYGTLKAKAAVRDVARVLGLSFMGADRLSKLIPDQLGIKLSEAIEQVDTLQMLIEKDPLVRRVFSLAQRIEGAMRQTSVHAAGVVVADRPLVEYAPLYRDSADGGPVVQFDMKSAEAIGLIKFDFLGLKTLDQIRDAVENIRQNFGVDVDMSTLPWDDEKTYELLQAGDTFGVFQLESAGMRDLMTKLKPNVIDDIVALVALYRPGPLESGMHLDFVERKHGRKKVEYALPQLEPILSSTYGTIIYQEQVMQIAQVMADYSLGEADLLRRAMGKKKQSEMDKQRARFLSGSIANGIDEQKAADVFDLLAKFAAYGFNKSHSAAYGYISYQTAWLKAHYRAELMAGILTSEASNNDKVFTYIKDCERAGLQILSPCVNHSARSFTAHHDDGDAVRFGLCGVKNVGSGAIEAILEARDKAGGSFKAAFDFFDNVDFKRVNKRVVQSLMMSGAFDCFEESRASLLAGFEAAVNAGVRGQEDREAGQTMLFAGFDETSSSVSFRFPDVPKMSISERLQKEHDVLGFYLSGHPMEERQEEVAKFATAPVAELHRITRGTEVRVVGLPVDVKMNRTRRGDNMGRARIEDGKNSVESVLFSSAWARSQKAMKSGKPVLVTGKLEERGDELQIRVETVELLDDVRARSVEVVTISLGVDELDSEHLLELQRQLIRLNGPCDTRLMLQLHSGVIAQLDLPFSVNPSLEFESTMKTLFSREGVVSIW